MTRVLICGGRNYSDRKRLRFVLNKLHEKRGFTAVATGAAAGADFEGEMWAAIAGLPVSKYPADWRRDGKGAGPRRNARMLAEFKPDLVVAFPGGRGTADMIRRAEAAGVEVIEAHKQVFTDWIVAAWARK